MKKNDNYNFTQYKDLRTKQFILFWILFPRNANVLLNDKFYKIGEILYWFEKKNIEGG